MQNLALDSHQSSLTGRHDVEGGAINMVTRGRQRVVQGERHKTLSRVRCEEVKGMCRILDKAAPEAVE